MSSACQEAEGLPVEVKVTSKGDGLYSCSYVPASPIKHTLAITWGGVSIPHSPFRVSSQSQRLLTAPGGAPPGRARDAQQPEILFKAERIEVAQSECAKTVQPRAEDVARKAKKPLIIMVTCSEEKRSA